MYRKRIAAAMILFACSESSDEQPSSSGAGASSAASTGSGANAGSGGGGSGGFGSGDGVVCAPGAAPCNPAAGEYCCMPIIAMPATCETDEASCDQNFAIVKRCDGPEDCMPGVCCYTMTGSGAAPEAGHVECASSCDSDNQQVVCDPAVPSSCDSGQTCEVAGTPMPVCQ